MTDADNEAGYVAVLIVVSIVGVFTNIFIVFSILLVKKYRKLENALLCSMSFGNLISVVVLDVIDISAILTGGTFLEAHSKLCLTTSYLKMSLHVCFIWTIAILSYQAYLRIFHPRNCHKTFNLTTVTVSLICIWTCTGILFLPSLIGWGRHSYNSQLRHCTYDFTFSPTYSVFLLLWGMLFPFTLIAYSFSRIAVDLFLSRNRQNNEDADMTPRRPEDIDFARCILSTFALFWGTSLYLFVIWLSGEGSWATLALKSAVALARLHPSFGGTLIILMNRNFRRSFLWLMKCCRSRDARIEPRMDSIATISPVSSTGSRGLDAEEAV